MPGGSTHAVASRSLSHAAVRSPRLTLTAVWIGLSTCIATNTTPISAKGAARLRPDRTASIRTPVAMANTGGSSPRAIRTPHQAAASRRSALGSTVKNFHSGRARNLLIPHAPSAPTVVMGPYSMPPTKDRASGARRPCGGLDRWPIGPGALRIDQDHAAADHVEQGRPVRGDLAAENLVVDRRR